MLYGPFDLAQLTEIMFFLQRLGWSCQLVAIANQRVNLVLHLYSIFINLAHSLSPFTFLHSTCKTMSIIFLKPNVNISPVVLTEKHILGIGGASSSLCTSLLTLSLKFPILLQHFHKPPSAYAFFIDRSIITDSMLILYISF